jgi:hypothetical protein
MIRIAAGFAVLAALPLAAQERRERVDPFGYKVVYTIRDDKAQRNYTLLVDAGGRGTLRSGNRVPVVTSSTHPDAGGGTTQYQYFDTGINIDCRVRETDAKVVLNSDLDISTVVEPVKAAGAASGPNPTVASVRVGGVSAVVAPGRPTVIASIDDPVTTRKLEIVATVTRLE